MELLLATNNAHKVKEMRALLDGLDLKIRATGEFAGMPTADENADDYAGNAAEKARVCAAFSGLPALADDSGLEVDALGGRPGVRSSRYAPSDTERIAKLLCELSDVPEERRGARFVCVMALAWPNGLIETRRGECPGRIGFAPSGAGGFGYDPVFILPERGLTMAELSEEEKNRVSHRARAAAAMRELLANVIPGENDTREIPPGRLA